MLTYYFLCNFSLLIIHCISLPIALCSIYDQLNDHFIYATKSLAFMELNISY